MNDAWFCRPACPLSLSGQNKWSAARQSQVHSVKWGRGDYPASATSRTLKGRSSRRIVLVLLSDPPSFSAPTEAVGDPGDNSSGSRCLNSHLHLLIGHRMGLWYDPALGGFSPPNSAAQQWPIHPVAPTTRINVFF